MTCLLLAVLLWITAGIGPARRAAKVDVLQLVIDWPLFVPEVGVMTSGGR